MEIPSPNTKEEFEDIILKIFSRHYNCDFIHYAKGGSAQYGIDLIGRKPKEMLETVIQCKKKDKSTNYKLNIREINEELKKFENFPIPVERYIFVTTNEPQKEVINYIKKIALENRQKNKFDIEIFHWKNIEIFLSDYIDIRDNYLFKNGLLNTVNLEVKIEGENNQNDLSNIIIPFVRKNIKYKKANTLFEQHKLMTQSLSRSIFDRKPNNKSIYWFKFSIKNIGSSNLENWKLKFEVIGDFKSIDVEDKTPPFFIRNNNIIPKYSTYYDQKLNEGIFLSEKILVPNDTFNSDSIYIKPLSTKETDIEIKYIVLDSKNSSITGSLKLHFNPDIISTEEIIYVNNESDEKEINNKITDYLVDY